MEERPILGLEKGRYIRDNEVSLLLVIMEKSSYKNAMNGVANF